MVGYRCTYQSRLKTVRSGDRHMTAGRINRGVLCVYRSQLRFSIFYFLNYLVMQLSFFLN